MNLRYYYYCKTIMILMNNAPFCSKSNYISVLRAFISRYRSAQFKILNSNFSTKKFDRIKSKHSLLRRDKCIIHLFFSLSAWKYFLIYLSNMSNLSKGIDFSTEAFHASKKFCLLWTKLPFPISFDNYVLLLLLHDSPT